MRVVGTQYHGSVKTFGKGQQNRRSNLSIDSEDGIVNQQSNENPVVSKKVLAIPVCGGCNLVVECVLL